MPNNLSVSDRYQNIGGSYAPNAMLACEKQGGSETGLTSVTFSWFLT